MNVEVGALSKLIKTGNIKLFTEEQVKANLFSGQNREVFKYILEYHLEFGVVPDKQVVRRYFPDFNIVKTSKRKPLKWFIKELRRKATHNLIAQAIENCYGFMDTGDTEAAKKEFTKVVSEINKNIEKSQDIELSSSADEMKDEFKRLEKLGGIIGIPTMIKELDNCLKGLQKEQLITIIARLGVGKTWFLILLLVNIYKQGYDVALGTTEMSVAMVRRRVVAMLYNIPYNQLRSGKMFFKDKKKYFEALDKLKKRKNKFWIFKVTGGVSFIRTKLEQYKPDILGIDGMYLMEDDAGATEENWKVTHITRDLHNLASDMKLPIVGTTQANRSTSKKTGPEVDNISYSDSVGQDSDVVAALNQTEEMRNDNEMDARILKQREGPRMTLRMEWDFRNMSFKSLYGQLEGAEFDDEEEKKSDSKTGKIRSVKDIGLKKVDTRKEEQPKKHKIKLKKRKKVA